MHEKVRWATYRRKKNLTGCIKDEGHTILRDESFKWSWTDYIKVLYTDDGGKEELEISRRMYGHMITSAEIKQFMEK